LPFLRIRDCHLEVSVCDESLPYTSVVAGEHKVLDGLLMVSVVVIEVMVVVVVIVMRVGRE
jgi:hypothetical protein